MTDSKTATERLRELLDERGVEWTKGDAACQIEWTNQRGQRCSAMYWKPTLTVLISGCTPEQAIAATLSSSQVQVRDIWNEIISRHEVMLSDDEYKRGYDDGLRANTGAAFSAAKQAFGAGECEMEPSFTQPSTVDDCQEYRCSECGEYMMWQEGEPGDMPRFCGNCGRKVKQ